MTTGFNRAADMPPCARCNEPIVAGQWITSDGIHDACTDDGGRAHANADGRWNTWGGDGVGP